MEAVAPQQTATSNKSLSQIQRLAWVIVVVSFAMFCSLGIAISGGIYYFLFRSTVPMDVILQVGQGSVELASIDNQQALRSPTAPIIITDRPATLSTGNIDQATISFRIPRESGENFVLGTLTLKNNSFITLQNASQPRFSWSDGVHTLEFSDFSGEAEIVIVEIPERPLIFRIRTFRGNATFVIDRVGRYSISANATSIRVITYEGRALLVSPDNRNNRFAVTGEQATLLTGANLPIVRPAPDNLITNGLFAFDITTNFETGQLQMPQQWGCFANFDAPPSGEWYADRWEGRPALRLIRETGDKSSQTGCSRWLDVPVNNYSLLELQATFLLNHQSLVNCGDVGSECPLMIFIDYVDVRGQDRTWSQSFFFNYDSQSPSPLVCQECALPYEHRLISDHVWYTYESGNLFSRLPEGEKPIRILEVRFYASGHQYDVFVSEVSLFAGTEQATVPIENVPTTRDN